MKWTDEITSVIDLTLFQWLVRESARCQQWADYYWDALDYPNEQSVTQALIQEYNDLCDWMDQLETDAEFLYHMRNM